MTRRFRRRRPAESRSLALGIAAASFLAVGGLVTFDLSGGRENPVLRAAAQSIDPAVPAGTESAGPAAEAERSPRAAVRAGLLVPGELLLEAERTDAPAPRGALLVNDRPVAYPGILDSVPAGTHALRLVDGGRVLWERDVVLEPGGVERVVVPGIAADSASTDSTGHPPRS